LSTEAGAVEIPAGALPDGVEITVAEVDESQIVAPLPLVLRAVAPAVAFTPHGTTFSMPVTLSLFHQGGSGNLVVLRLDDESDTDWERVDATFASGVAYVTSTHFSIYNVSECDPLNDPDGFCSGLASGDFEIDDIPEEDFEEFDAPSDFGSSGSSGNGGDLGGDRGGTGGSMVEPGDDECEEVCETFMRCAAEVGEPTDGEGSVSECSLEEEEVCWDPCGDGSKCEPPPFPLPTGCRYEDLGACTWNVVCDAVPLPSDCDDFVPNGCWQEWADNACGFVILCDQSTRPKGASRSGWRRPWRLRAMPQGARRLRQGGQP
jgi:hypothetical protein